MEWRGEDFVLRNVQPLMIIRGGPILNQQTAYYVGPIDDFSTGGTGNRLLLETGSFLLLETGDHLLLES